MCVGCGWRCSSISEVHNLQDELARVVEKANQLAEALYQEMSFCDMGCQAKIALEEWKNYQKTPETRKNG